MADDDLQAIRARRMQELQQQHGVSQEGDGAEKAKREQEEALMRNNILVQILDQQARARLNTIAIAKPEKAKMIENMLIQNARMGAIRGKLGEEQFKEFLEQFSEKTQRSSKVTFNRRRGGLDSDDDDY